MKVTGGILAIVGVILIIIMMPAMMGGISEAQTTQRADAISAPTGGGITTATVTLVTALYDEAIGNVVSITSTVGTDVPNPSTYTSASRNLLITGLTAGEAVRTVTVTYLTAALTGAAAPADTFLGFMPVLLIIAAVLIVVGAAIAMFK